MYTRKAKGETEASDSCSAHTGREVKAGPRPGHRPFGSSRAAPRGPAHTAWGEGRGEGRSPRDSAPSRVRPISDLVPCPPCAAPRPPARTPEAPPGPGRRKARGGPGAQARIPRGRALTRAPGDAGSAQARPSSPAPIPGHGHHFRSRHLAASSPRAALRPPLGPGAPGLVVPDPRSTFTRLGAVLSTGWEFRPSAPGTEAVSGPS